MTDTFLYSGTTTAFLNLREGPGTTFKIKKLLDPGVSLDVLMEEGNWLKVHAGMLEGFVHRSYVRISNNADQQVGITTDALNLRADATTKAAIKTTLPIGTSVTILTKRGEWYHVRVNGQEGFVHSAFIRLSGQDQGQGVPSGYLIHSTEFKSLALAPNKKLTASTAHSQAQMVARIWNQFGGLLDVLSARLKIDPAVAVAVVAAESGGQGFSADGRMIIRFENHIFWAKWGQSHTHIFQVHYYFNNTRRWEEHRFRSNPHESWRSFHGDQQREWEAFTFARNLDDHAAKLSISMGLPQIMGFNYAAIGYHSVEAMFDSFSVDARNQLLGFFDFIQGPHMTSKRIAALQRRDFVTFAAQYNGSGQAERYGTMIRDLAGVFNTLEPAV